MPALITPSMRQAAPELCQQMDQLRVERKCAVERRCYLSSSGKEEEAAAQQQRITEIDAEVAALHARAKQQLLTGVASNLAHGATMLQDAMMQAGSLRVCMLAETQRHREAMAKLAAKQEDLDPAFQKAIRTMHESGRIFAMSTKS